MSLPPPTNYFGQEILNPFQLASPDFGTGGTDKYGNPIIDWEGHRTDYADEYGFDKRNIEENGQYIITYILPKDAVLVRFGTEWGQYTAPQNTAYKELALPYTIESVEYHEYRVIADGLTVQCVVNKGRVAPMFLQPGGGVQYRHKKAIRFLIKAKQLERIR